MSHGRQVRYRRMMALGAHLARDPIIRFASVVALAVGLLYTLPGVPDPLVDAFDSHIGVPIFLALVLLAILAFPRLRGPRQERRFWLLVAVAFSCWLVERLVSILPGLEGSLTGLRIHDVLMLEFYLFLVLASETRPDRGAMGSGTRTVRNLGLAGTVIFLLAVLTYFVIIPSQADRADYEGLLPSYSMFIVLDLYLVFRWMVLAREAGGARLKAVYGLLAIAAALWAGVDLLELLNQTAVLTIAGTSPLSLVWYTPLLSVIAATRLRWGLVPEEDRASGQPAPSRGLVPATPLVFYAFLLPALHFLLSATGLAGAASRSARELLLLAHLLLLGGLAVAQQRSMARTRHELEERLRRARAELHRAQRLDAIGRLAGGVAHDLNNVLMVLRGSAEMLRTTGGETPRGQNLLDTLDKAIDHAGGLTGHLLAVARSQSLRVKTLDPEAIVSDSGIVLARVLGPAISLRTRFHCGGSRIRVDPDQLRRVLINLATNARDAMPRGGTLSISLRNVWLSEEDCQKLPGLSEGQFVALEVADSGLGIDRQTLEHVFEPFFTTKDPGSGSGLGLATVYGIVMQSGGAIHVDSTVGEGTTFTIYLPQVSPRAPHVEEALRRVVAGSAPHPDGPAAAVEPEAGGDASDRSPKRTLGRGPSV